MSQIQLNWSGWGFTSDHAPTSNEPWDGIMQYGSFLVDENNIVWWCSNQGANNDNTGLQWKYAFKFQDNAPSVISQLNTSRSYIPRVSPAFSIAYIPSTTNDTMVSVRVNVVSTLVTPGTVLFEINTGSGYVIIGEASISGVVASEFQTITCLVPTNASYQLINSSGTATIISINEIQL